MAAVKERTPTMVQCPCSCGNEMKQTVGTVIHKINGKQIKLHNIPHYECADCGTIEYNIKQVKVTPLLRYALKHDLNEVDYIDYQKNH
ncbi:MULTISPECIES: YgiT-type zinc finger protein [Bacillus mojavensis subgroup]|uniref:YgiT-type zinc finger protein n=1 Tax=Bacillus mojavensis subgroup TaxID=653388 RepID=UPI0018F12ADC|nr:MULTISPECIES: YgiT-type zinc finger protein [Bacillus mojavensis subgroup]MBJ7572691.1 YgiT-type zinc finger protein [Bacillus halotolerans]MEC1670580.1 YgiT-type zinc finger protein [Bacillus mojavensis]